MLSLIALLTAFAQPVGAPAPPRMRLPVATDRPLAIDFSDDPVLALARTSSTVDPFRTVIVAAVERSPATGENAAAQLEAVYRRDEARETQLPTVDINLSSYRVLSRAFSNDPQNVIERSRPRERTDALVTVQQLLFDFGASEARIRAAGARIRAAGADLESAADQVAVQAIAGWYDVFGYRALVMLAQAFINDERDLRAAIEERIGLGASAEGDLARVDSFIAQGDIRLAQFHRQLAGAEARLREMTGAAPPALIERAPAPQLDIDTRDEAAAAAGNRPAVRSAAAAAVAARQDARAASRDRLPQVTAGIDAGRYGVFETERDYDVRGRIGLRQRFFGGQDPRAHQAGARVLAADARADRIREEAERDAAIAFADVQALELQLEALDRAYRASRQSRDVIAARFRAIRGTLFDVIDAEQNYFSAATSFIQGLIELDSARYVLLSRTGRLLDTLGIRADRLEMRP
jgi:outer membrane protein, adhesin transport system